MTSAISNSWITELRSGDSLKARALRATMLTVTGYGASRAIRLASNLILTRLLIPEAFGLMLIVNMVTQGLQMFSDVGIGPSIIQNRRGAESAYVNTAWTIQVIRGFILWIVSCGVAWPITQFYSDKPELLWLIPAASVSAIICGFESTKIHTLNRELLIGRETILELGARLITLVATIVVAIITRSVWALVVGSVLSQLGKTVLSHAFLPGERNRLMWDRSAAAELFRFGRWIFLSTLLTFVAMSADRIILGKMIPTAVLGVYAIAYIYYDVPRTLLMRLSRKIIYPMMSRRSRLERHEFLHRVASNRWKILAPAAIVLAALVAFGDEAIRLMYRPEYWHAGWMLVLLAAGMWFRVLDQTISPSLMVFERLQYNPIGSVLRVAFIGIGLPVAVSTWGLWAGLVVIAAGDIPNYVVDSVGLLRNRLSLLRQDLAATLLFLAVIAGLVQFRALCGWGNPIEAMLQAQVIPELSEHLPAMIE